MNIDRSLELNSSSPSVVSRVLQDIWTATDFLGPAASFSATISNWVTKRGADRWARKSLEALLGMHSDTANKAAVLKPLPLLLLFPILSDLPGISRKADLPSYVPRSKVLPFALEARDIEDVNPEVCLSYITPPHSLNVL